MNEKLPFLKLYTPLIN